MRNNHLRRIGCGVLAVLVLIGLLASGEPGPEITSAQEGDDEQDTGLIYAYNQFEMLFPVGMRFLVEINTALDQIVVATLTISQENGYEQMFVLNPPEQYLYEGTAAITKLLYTWEWTDTPELPVLFEDTTYTWQVITRDDMESVASYPFVFEDVRQGTWKTAGEPPLILHWSNEKLAGRSIRDTVMDQAYELLSRETGLELSFEYALYDYNAAFCERVRSPETETMHDVLVSEWGVHVDDEGVIVYPCSVEAFEQLYASRNVTLLQRPNADYADLRDVLITTIVNETYAKLWQNSAVPAWFRSGLASLYRIRAGGPELELHVKPAARVDESSLLTIPDLAILPPDDDDSRALWEAQSYLLALYLVDTYGLDAVFELARTIPEYRDGFDGALRTLTGRGQETLWDSWTRWIFSQDAARAVMWTPYTPITPTPTLTPTASNTPTITPIPPTLTPSHTPTVTLTPTTTFEADQPVTVVSLPTRTPTRVSSPLPPPLPAGELPTVTPAVSETEAAADNGGADSAIIGSIIALIAAALVVGAAGVVVWRRRR